MNMHVTKRFTLGLCSMIVSVLMITACEEAATDAGNIDDIRTGENYTFYKSPEKAEETGKNRSTEISDPFEIEDVRITEENGRRIMHIDVTLAEGCSDAYPGKFEVIWDGVMIMIYPPQVGFYLAYHADGCGQLRENVQETVVLDLDDIFEEEGFGENAQFTVANASKRSTDNDIEVSR